MRLDNLRMYQAAEALAAETEKLLPRSRAARPNAANQLENSCDSVLFDMSEGIGSLRTKRRLRRMRFRGRKRTKFAQRCASS
jgi:hypothetical protein